MYTPGPWKYGKLDDDNFGISAGWIDIATVHNRDDDPVDEANARLIAQAPALIEALNSIRVNCEVWQSRESEMSAGDFLALIEEEAVAALAAAGRIE